MMLKMSIRDLGGITVLDCFGRIIFGEETAALRDEVKKIIADNRSLVLNLAGVNYVDSGGLGTLVSLYSIAKASGSTMKLANLTPRVGDLLQVTKLVTVFDVYDNEGQAVEALRRTAVA